MTTTPLHPPMPLSARPRPNPCERPLLGNGYTLVELLVVLAIVGILSVISYGVYDQAMLKGRRAEARTALLQLLQQQERYYTQFNTYVAYDQGSTEGDAANFKNHSGDNANGARYLLGAELCKEPDNDLQRCVRAFAEPRGFTDNHCGRLRITSLGVKDALVNSAVSTNAECWK